MNIVCRFVLTIVRNKTISIPAIVVDWSLEHLRQNCIKLDSQVCCFSMWINSVTTFKHARNLHILFLKIVLSMGPSCKRWSKCWFNFGWLRFRKNMYVRLRSPHEHYLTSCSSFLPAGFLHRQLVAFSIEKLVPAWTFTLSVSSRQKQQHNTKHYRVHVFFQWAFTNRVNWHIKWGSFIPTVACDVCDQNRCNAFS